MGRLGEAPRGIVEKQKAEGWGESVVERLSTDLRAEFPNMRGFFGRNLRDMRRFFLAYTEDEFWRQAVAKLTNARGGKSVLEQAVPEKGVCFSTTYSTPRCGRSTRGTPMLKVHCPGSGWRMLRFRTDKAHPQPLPRVKIQGLTPSDLPCSPGALGEEPDRSAWE